MLMLWSAKTYFQYLLPFAKKTLRRNILFPYPLSHSHLCAVSFSTDDNSKPPESTDTETPKSRIFGSPTNKGLASGTRPHFQPEDTNVLMSSNTSNNGNTAALDSNSESLEPPTNCCMSGCPNCVWLEYVERVVKHYVSPELSKAKVLKELDNMEDENIKAFIRMELRYRKLI